MILIITIYNNIDILKCIVIKKGTQCQNVCVVFSCQEFENKDKNKLKTIFLLFFNNLNTKK